MKREEGYYWAYVADRWVILEWFKGLWFAMADPDSIQDVVLEVDERRLVRS